MNSAVNELVKSVIARNSLSDCTVSELQQLASQYPYFGPVQFLLAQKLKQENSPLYHQQAQRAILYFQDQLWFDYLSSGEDSNASLTTNRHEPPVNETVQVTNTETVEKEVAEVEVQETISAPLYEEPTEIKQHVTEEDTDKDSAAENQAPVDFKEPDIPVTEPVAVSVNEYNSPERPENQDEIEPGDPVEETKEPVLPLIGIIQQPAIDKDTTLTFEPYHTVDYFASQGIRFKEEEKPKDRFGQQLKSFTEWLKTIKKAPGTTAPNIPPVVSEDNKVVQLAEHSIVDREVVTEAMADVWEQQGNREKAIAIYRKLSLLNPAKSSYFAAKIEHLKNP